MVKAYRNPILPGFYPDPSICRVGEDFYMVTSSFEYFPGIPIFHSRDLVHWEQLGHCLTKESQLPLDGVECSGGIWAPTIRWHNGTFYVTSTNVSLGGNFYVTASNPAGEWSEPVHVAMAGIDPSFTFDESKAYYMTNQASADGTAGISMAEINPETGELLSDIRFLWAGSGGRAQEAPHLYHIGKWYYLMIAEGGTQFTHMETIARSKSIWGPYEACPRNPILSGVSALGDVHCPGHGDLVEDLQGNWWMVHLGIRISRKYMSHLGRETFLSPVTWDCEGWPIVNGSKYVDTAAHGPLPADYPLPVENECDDFESEILSFFWNTLRGVCSNGWSLTDRKGWLTLYGNEYCPDDTASMAFVGRRQRYFDCTMETSMEFNPQRDNEEAGILLLLSNDFYYKFCKRIVEGVPCLLLEKRAEDFRQTAGCVQIPEGEITLRVYADREKYVFTFSTHDAKETNVAAASTRFLACEVAGRSFTGVYAGMYTTGNGTNSTAPAYFDYFKLSIDKK